MYKSAIMGSGTLRLMSFMKRCEIVYLEGFHVEMD